MNEITAKVRCDSKIVTGEGDDRRALVTISANYADGRNAEWAKFTPHLNLTMTLNAQASGLFKAGKGYTLLFVEDDESSAA